MDRPLTQNVQPKVLFYNSYGALLLNPKLPYARFITHIKAKFL